MEGGLSFEPLTPTAFLRRAATVHGARLAVIDGERQLSYVQLWARSRGLAGGLSQLAEPGARVAVLASSSSLMLEAHHGVLLAGQVLVPLNTRLAVPELAYAVGHSDAGVLLCDRELAPLAHDVADRSAGAVAVVAEGDDYEALVAATAVERPVADERALLSINYTSGTTGRPKGAMYHHRGAYLQALAMVVHLGFGPDSRYLWTLPMFHCHGWCCTWAVTAAGGTHICLRRVDPSRVWEYIRGDGVTHLNAAPAVLTAIASCPDAGAGATGRRVRVATGGAPPSPTLLAQLDALGMDVTHLYGLTETFGPALVCEWHPEWTARPLEARAALLARQGVGNVASVGPRVLGLDGADVPPDGETMGEVALRGNNVMLGYHRDPQATAHAVRDGWFRTGDLGVMHPDGYVELRDRRKDMIVSGGENIASVEIEQAIVSHPGVLEAAVIAVPDERWGERPAAYVVARPGRPVTPEEIIAHAQTGLARFKVPREVVLVADLPKTSTGKIQKNVLREQAWEGRERRIG